MKNDLYHFYDHFSDSNFLIGFFCGEMGTYCVYENALCGIHFCFFDEIEKGLFWNYNYACFYLDYEILIF